MQSGVLRHLTEYGTYQAPLKRLMSFATRFVLSNDRRKKPKPNMKRVAVFQPEFREDLKYWVETDRQTALRVLQLLIII